MAYGRQRRKIAMLLRHGLVSVRLSLLAGQVKPDGLDGDLKYLNKWGEGRSDRLNTPASMPTTNHPCAVAF